MWKVLSFPKFKMDIWFTFILSFFHNRVTFFFQSEISPLLHQSNCLEAEMVHFVHQMQYYITFEVRILFFL